MPEYFRAPEFEAYRIDQSLAIAISKAWCEAKLLTLAEVQAMMLCVGIKTLEQHTRLLSESTQTTPAEAEQLVKGLARRDCLLQCRDSTWTETCGASRPTAISALGVVTADRPDALDRCINSYAANLNRFERSHVRLIVVDESSHESSAAGNERVVRQCSSTHRIEADYWGRVRQEALWARLREVAGPEWTDWSDLVVPGTFNAGAGRNILLLLTAGENVLMVDDDTVCQTWKLDDADDTIELCGHFDPRATTFLPNRESAIRHIARTDADIVGEHEHLLGKTLRELAGDRKADNACCHIVDAIEDPSAKVRVTTAGVAGDSGEYCPYTLLFRPGLGRQTASADLGSLRLALAMREGIRAARRPTVTDMPVCMTICTAIDNTTLTPPFIPVGRAEDGLFAELLRQLDCPAWFGHLSCGILHDSGRPAEYCEEPASASETRVADSIRILASHWRGAVRYRTAEARLRALGGYLLEVAEQPFSQFRMQLARTIVETRCRWLDEAARWADTAACHPEWRAALQRYRSAFAQSVRTPAFLVPVEVRHDQPGNGLAVFRRCLARFAEGLRAWPSVWRLARELSFHA